MPELECQTRKERVDVGLKAQGWTVAPFQHGRSYARHAVEEFPTDNGSADYGLAVNGRVLGVAEAKRLTLGPQGVLPEAERYARGLAGSGFDFDGLRAPFLYSTNGEVLWFRDARHALNTSRQIAAFEDGEKHHPKVLPRSYLQSPKAGHAHVFARFVRDKPAHIEAIRIPLNRPQEWSTQALGELR
jgi:type I site-specific restriction endonuclease